MNAATRWSKDTPLHFATQLSVATIVSTLVKEGARVNARNDDGNTPLHHAAPWSKAPAVVATLLKAGAQVNAREEYCGETPLHEVAAHSESPAAVAELLKAGADVNAWSRKLVMIRYKALGFKDHDYYWIATPLHLAAKNNKNPEVITFLVKAGADVNAKDQFGITLLHLAVKWSESPDVVTALIKAGADVNAKNIYGDTPQEMSRPNENPEVVAAFMKAAYVIENIDTMKKDNVIFTTDKVPGIAVFGRS